MWQSMVKLIMAEVENNEQQWATLVVTMAMIIMRAMTIAAAKAMVMMRAMVQHCSDQHWVEKAATCRFNSTTL